MSNIEHLGQNSKKNAEQILLLYCGLICILDTRDATKKIVLLRKKYNVKLTNLCLTYLLKNKANITKNIVKIFVEDKVVPTEEQIAQYIKVCFSGNYCDLLMQLTDW